MRTVSKVSAFILFPKHDAIKKTFLRFLLSEINIDICPVEISLLQNFVLISINKLQKFIPNKIKFILQKLKLSH